MISNVLLRTSRKDSSLDHNLLLPRSSLLAGGLMLAAALPALAGPPDFAMNVVDRLAGNNGVRDNKPNVSIPVAPPVVNNGAVTRAASAGRGPALSIDSSATRIIQPQFSTRMPPTMQIPTIQTMPNIPIIRSPDVGTKNIQITPVSHSGAINVGKDNFSDVSSSVRGREGGRGANVQLASFQAPSAGQAGAAPDATNPGQSQASGASQAQDIESQVHVGNGFGNVVTSDFMEDPLDIDGIKKEISGKIALFEGTTLFIPSEDMVIDTRHGKVKMTAHSVVLVSSSQSELAVYDIHDHKKGAVTVNAQGKTMKLAPGRHVVITTDDSGEFAMANAIDVIPHTDVRTMEKGEKTTIFTSEFSIPAAINSVNALKSLTSSPDPDLQKVANKVMKTAAIKMYMGNPNYKHYLRPRVTLLSQGN